MRRICCAAVFFLLAFLQPPATGAAGNPLQETAKFTPAVTESMLDAEFWIRRATDPEKVLMTPDEIIRFNRSLAAEFDYIKEIENHPEVSGEQVKSRIEAYRLPYGQKRYNSRNEPVGDGFYDVLREEMILETIPEKVKPLWGVTVRRTSIRSFPTSESSLTAADPQASDLFQETEADIWTPLVILHRSKNGQWAFVRIYHYNGWMKLEDVAVANDKQALFSLLNQQEFLVATGSWVESQITENASPKIRFMMGTRIPLVPRERIPRELFRHNPQGNYVAWVPARDEKGFFAPVMAYISTQADVHPGYLPYTRRNLIRQVFKMVGERYSWGGSFEGRDCSRLIVDAYRTIGIMLPRNASEQMKVGLDRFENNVGERFVRLNPGAGLYMPGHSMMFIGNHDGKSFMIHSTAAYRNIPGEDIRPVRGVVVTDMSILKDGIRSIQTAREFILPF
jgi:cell wall-associated NlpC family hydrolase